MSGPHCNDSLRTGRAPRDSVSYINYCMETEIKLNEVTRLTKNAAFASSTIKEGFRLSLDEI